MPSYINGLPIDLPRSGYGGTGGVQINPPGGPAVQPWGDPAVEINPGSYAPVNLSNTLGRILQRRGRPVGGPTFGGATGNLSDRPAGSGDRLSGDAYDLASHAENLALMQSQAYAGAPNSTGTTQDTGHTAFEAQSHTHGLMDDGIVTIQPGGIYQTVFRNGMGAGNPNAFRSGRYAPPIGTGDEPFVGPRPAPQARNFTNYASRTLGY